MNHLILGGARSGKSSFAEALALESHRQKNTNKLVYLATSEVWDFEMQQRVDTHKARRAEQWQLVECPINIVNYIKTQTSDTIILLDCLTLWLNNIMYHKLDVEYEIMKLGKAIAKSQAQVFMVSNELGYGLVPETKLGRDFRDYQGKLNQNIAQKVDKVALVVAGLPIWLK